MGRIIFENRLEYKFYQIYKMLPFSMIELLIDNGHDRDYASQTVQLIMDNLWEHELQQEAERKARDQALLDAECPWR